MAVSGKIRIVGAVVVLALGATLLWLRPWAIDDGPSDRLYGNVDVREVQLAFRVAGRLADVLVDEGDAVVAGQTLARLDPEPAREALAVAEADVAEARARLARVRAGARPEEIEQARAAVSEARAAFDNARADDRRQQELLRTQSTSRTAADAARAARDRAAARLVSAEKALALAEAGARAEDIAVAQAAVVSARARLSQTATALEDTELVAPAEGIVLTRAREPGSLVAEGQGVLALALTDRVYVRAYVDEPRLGRVAPGTPVAIRTDSSGHVYSGQVGFVSPRAEFTPKSVETPELRTDLVYRLRIVVDDADTALRQGMPVTVSVGEKAAELAAR